ncbi:hypothetical protein [Streptomyces sp. CA-106131]
MVVVALCLPVAMLLLLLGTDAYDNLLSRSTKQPTDPPPPQWCPHT